MCCLRGPAFVSFVDFVAHLFGTEGVTDIGIEKLDYS